MTIEQRGTTSSLNSAEETELSASEADVIYDRQVSVLRQLNDELLRTTRIQAIIGAGVITLITFLDPQLFLPQSNNPLWLVGFTIALLSFLPWYTHLGAARVSYTELQLGAHHEIGEDIVDISKKHPSLIRRFKQRVRDFFSDAIIHLPTVLYTFAGVTLTVHQFEKEIDHEDTRNLIAVNHTKAIKHNNWILRTRERYVNVVRGYLNWTFLLFLIGILLLVVY